MKSRREAIFILAGIAVSSLIGPKIHKSSYAKSNSGSKPSVIVIGSGMSGAKAARDLTDAGCQVTTLEARERIGGRIWTDRSMGTAVDLGASWIHESRGNPIDNLARKLSVPLYEWDYENINYCGPNAEKVYYAMMRFEDKMWSIGERVYSKNQQASVKDLVDAMKEDGIFSGLTDAEAALIVRLFIEQGAAADSGQLALEGLVEGKEFNGPDMLFPKGYDELVKALLTDIDVKHGEAVSQIDHTGSGVKVTTNKNNYEADCVLVTVSLGVLKSDQISFNPALPDEKKEAIDKLEMGVLNKVCLKFPSVFWDKDTNVFVCAHNNGTEWVTWFNMVKVTGEPVLVALNGGGFGRELEGYSDDEITKRALESLKPFYGKAVSEPTQRLITRWANDKYAYGSYSYIPPGASSKMRDYLAQAIDKKIYFSGEATTRDYPATVHGAFLTGARAASEILKR